MILVPDYLFPQAGDSVREHRFKLKRWLLQRQFMCAGCWQPLGASTAGVHMHECMISRGNVQGWQPKGRRVLIFTAYNCLLLCRDCNLSLGGKNPPGRLVAFKRQCKLYGEEAVVQWLKSLPFKAHPLKGILEQY